MHAVCDSVHVSTYPVRTIVAQQFDRRGGWKKKLAALAIQIAIHVHVHASCVFPPVDGAVGSLVMVGM